MKIIPFRQSRVNLSGKKAHLMNNAAQAFVYLHTQHPSDIRDLRPVSHLQHDLHAVWQADDPVAKRSLGKIIPIHHSLMHTQLIFAA